MLGAAFAAMAPGVPSWETGFGDGSNVGGLIAAILEPAGGFGKFLVVLIALSIPSACAPTMYTFGRIVSPLALHFLVIFLYPRHKLYVNCAVFRPGTALRIRGHFRSHVCSYPVAVKFHSDSTPSLIPVAIVGATRFYSTLVNILSESKWPICSYTVCTDDTSQVLSGIGRQRLQRSC